ncbi:MAG: hypothetical protein IKP66_09885, partial [Lachnospiraceae bacterium]|nr:hypothetical protein [Lachnospiraceae bacterium]
MQFIFRNKKIIALLLIVSQLIVNAGTQTFAMSFSKIVNNTLEGMEQSEDISSKYYEEFHYESRTYLFNDSDNFDDEKDDIANIDEDERGLQNLPVQDEEEYEEEPEEDKEEYEEEPKEDIEEHEEESEEDIEEHEEESEEDIEEHEEESEETEEVYEGESEEEVVESYEKDEKESIEDESAEKEVATVSEVDEDDEEGSQDSLVQDEKENIEQENVVASSSEVEDENEIATMSELEEEIQLEFLSLKNDDKLLGAPGDPGWSGEHVHKECGVASGSDCVHTEYAAHGIDDGLDYKRLEFDDHFGEFIDHLAGWTSVGDERVAIDHPEYFYLNEDVTFIKDGPGDPRDQGTAFYAIDLQRDLYLCLNGHTLTNFTFKSTGNYKLVITDCLGGGTSGTIRSVEEEGLMFDLPVQIFGLSESDKIKINTTRIAALNTQVQAMNTTFYNVIFDGTDSPSFDYSEDSYDQMIRLYYNNTSLNLKFENCDFANWGKVTGSSDVNSTGNMLLRFYTTGTVTFNNVNVYNNVGL